VPHSTKKLRVLVVDDSALIRRLLTDILSSDPDIEVVDTASDAHVAREKIKYYKPDMITLDVEMPKMDGLTFLSHLMRLHPLPVLMISSLTEKGASVTLEALEIGAVDFVAKPAIDVTHSLTDYAAEIIAKVKAAPMLFARAKGMHKPRVERAPTEKSGTGLGFSATEQIVAIGASTGGTEAIREVVDDLPGDFPGTVIVQHIPAMFSRQFAVRLNLSAAMHVREAVHGERILRGHVYVSPGDQHLEVHRDGATYRCVLLSTAPVNRHRPAVDVLFDSVAKSVGGNAVGVILTGMGKDGAQGMLRMKNAGAPTIAQDEASSVVWGMPGAAVEAGGVEIVLPLDKIALRMRALVNARNPERQSRETSGVAQRVGGGKQ
jgi:two-component system, chemotaxis family, protein-glutamate methylesterase/glutaminase